jgi:hypothetical protein
METTVNGNDLVGKAVATAVSKFIQEGIAKDIKEGAPEHFYTTHRNLATALSENTPLGVDETLLLYMYCDGLYRSHFDWDTVESLSEGDRETIYDEGEMYNTREAVAYKLTQWGHDPDQLHINDLEKAVEIIERWCDEWKDEDPDHDDVLRITDQQRIAEKLNAMALAFKERQVHALDPTTMVLDTVRAAERKEARVNRKEPRGLDR